jgi:phage shock protein C
MFCTRCGIQMSDLDRFCSQCGHVAPGHAAAQSAATSNQTPATATTLGGASYGSPAPFMEADPPLTRSLRNRKIAGVCGGIGRHFGVDPTIVRILFVVMFFCPVLPAIIPYIVCWFVMPLERPQPAPQPMYSMPPQHQPLASMGR